MQRILQNAGLSFPGSRRLSEAIPGPPERPLPSDDGRWGLKGKRNAGLAVAGGPVACRLVRAQHEADRPG